MTDLVLSPTTAMLAAGTLLLLSVLANRLSDNFGVPALIMFLLVGMLAGSDGIGGIHFDNPSAANFVGVIALAYILFSGGLDTEWRSVRPVLWRATILSTFGVTITAALVGVFVWKVLGFTLKEGLLLGAIVSSTDAAAVFSIMRARGVGLRGRLKPLLELESGSNDPMAAFLTIAAIGWLMSPEMSWQELLVSLGIRMTIGLLVGVAIGFMASFVLDRLRLEYDGLYPVLSTSIVLLSYSLSDVIQGNGFLAVYASGIVLGNREFFHKQFLTRFHDGLAWLMQVILFVVLGLLVFPSRLPEVAGSALLVSAFLMFVARPVAVYLGLWGSSFTMAEKTLVAWTGLRGAVPIVLATFPFTAGYEHSESMFNIVFFIVLTSVILQGRTLMWMAKWLKVDAPLLARPAHPTETETPVVVKGDVCEIVVPPDSQLVGKMVLELGLPKSVLIVMIRREDKFIIPKGRTSLKPFDTVSLIADRDGLKQARNLMLSPEQNKDSADK
jgi:potassium/hydrogen antiporter